MQNWLLQTAKKWQEYAKLVQSKNAFIEFMRKSPLLGIKLDLKRDTSATRDV